MRLEHLIIGSAPPLVGLRYLAAWAASKVTRPNRAALRGPLPPPMSLGRSVGGGIAALLASLSVAAASSGEGSPRRIDFNRDVRPILSDACVSCHGPDASKRKGLGRPLRLDTQEGATEDLGGYAAIVRGRPDESEALRRITSEDSNEVMPPARTGKRLSPKEVETLTLWIAQGAPYAKHWAYVKPTRPPLPEVRNAAWPRGPIDRFLLARMEHEGLTPSPEADKATLIRRLSRDLTGLPPSIAEVEEFAADPAPDAYERLVDRLLAKPAYGEHWARMWLDLARYADSAGYADDAPRNIWAYRDWVIRAFNANMPFDRFTIEQLAGDLLPEPTDDQLIATAFHRNTLTNNEGGTDDEEFRNVAVVDRVNTTVAVWMGTTMACAQCHDHKYDPFSQADYFKIFAFFNNTQDADRGDDSPLLEIFTEPQKRLRAELSAEIAPLEAIVRTATPELASSQERWEASVIVARRVGPPARSTLETRAGTPLASLDVIVPPMSLVEDVGRDAEGEIPIVPAAIIEIAKIPREARSDAQREELARHYREVVAPALAPTRKLLNALKDQLAAIKPETTVPILKETGPSARRKTRIQRRGSFLDLDAEVSEGVPGAFHPFPQGAPINRLGLAKWLVADDNPLVARVTANRYWDVLFGIGLVPTGEDFGSQGTPPTHPELLDWLASELRESHWDIKAFLKLLVTSSAYRQQSALAPEISGRDPENRFVARGPRFRLPAEAIRDQALFASGLLSPKLYGPPVRPPQPASGLSAAFGGGIDWETSRGEDRYRRALYTSWRRSNPYPSLATFDAPNREVCLVRRSRTNTPLQALVTLNDPVFIEAAQALARRMASHGANPADKVRYGFRLCLSRGPSVEETTHLVALYGAALAEFARDPDKAVKLATDPIGPSPEGMDAADLAAWTVVGNVLLNLDEMLMTR